MNCPKCHNATHAVSVGEFTVDRCGTCEGIWFDLREHDHLVKVSGSEAVIDTGDPERGSRTNLIRDIICPRCNVKLVKLTFPDQPHIKYEQCSTCGGVFLDAGEFTDLKKFTLAERLKHLFATFHR